MSNTTTSRQFWIQSIGHGEIVHAELPMRRTNEVLVRTLYSGISRGTESLVFRGQVPPSQFQSMRAPFQEGEFPAPIKYGYINVGVIEAGPESLVGEVVFCLYPHQDFYCVPETAVASVPKDVPAERAVLAAYMQTAINAVWDGRPSVGDQVVVVGAGAVVFSWLGYVVKFQAYKLRWSIPMILGSLSQKNWSCCLSQIYRPEHKRMLLFTRVANLQVW